MILINQILVLFLLFYHIIEVNIIKEGSFDIKYHVSESNLHQNFSSVQKCCHLNLIVPILYHRYLSSIWKLVLSEPVYLRIFLRIRHFMENTNKFLTSMHQKRALFEKPVRLIDIFILFIILIKLFHFKNTFILRVVISQIEDV